VVRNQRERGYSLLEVIVAMSIFAMFLAVVFTLTAEMRAYEKRLPINMLKNPAVGGLLSRVRRDVLDGHGSNPFRTKYKEFKSDEKVLILETMRPNGGVEMVVWDFREPREVRRNSWNVGVKSEWVARGLPEGFSAAISAESVPNAKAWGVRIKATDTNGRPAIDQLLLTRATRDDSAPAKTTTE
jgi:prepilin-type N-terminal cleavage/methylation domain-containing protein